MSYLNLYFFGVPRIVKDDVPIEISRRKAVALLAYLAVAGGSQGRDRLAALLWPGHDQSRARSDLRRILSVLNKVLGEGWLKVDREMVGLNPEVDLWSDVDGFRYCLSQIRTHGHPFTEVCSDCVGLLTEAVGLYHGEFLEGFSLQDSVNFDDWVFSETQNLHAEMVSALERLVDWHKDQEELDSAIGHARRWLEIDRADEGAHRRLMELYAKTGRRSSALRQYEECVRILKEELSTSPQPDTVDLYKAIVENVFPAEEASSSAKGKEKTQVVSVYKSDETPTNNLPVQLTSFIGREGEMADIVRLLTTTHLLTLTGAGGCGKTRLALEVASSLVDEYGDGVWYVELAPLSDPNLVPQQVASVLDIIDSSILKGTVITTSKGGQFAG